MLKVMEDDEVHCVKAFKLSYLLLSCLQRLLVNSIIRLFRNIFICVILLNFLHVPRQHVAQSNIEYRNSLSKSKISMFQLIKTNFWNIFSNLLSKSFSPRAHSTDPNSPQSLKNLTTLSEHIFKIFLPAEHFPHQAFSSWLITLLFHRSARAQFHRAHLKPKHVSQVKQHNGDCFDHLCLWTLHFLNYFHFHNHN